MTLIITHINILQMSIILSTLCIIPLIKEKGDLQIWVSLDKNIINHYTLLQELSQHIILLLPLITNLLHNSITQVHMGKGHIIQIMISLYNITTQVGMGKSMDILMYILTSNTTIQLFTLKTHTINHTRKGMHHTKANFRTPTMLNMVALVMGDPPISFFLAPLIEKCETHSEKKCA